MYVPLLSDMSHMAKNIGGSLNFGYDLIGGPSESKKPWGTNVKSLGGAMTMFGLAPIGAAAGAAIGSQLAGDDVVGGATVGAGVGFAAGALALPATGMAARGVMGLGTAAVKATPGMISNLPGMAAGIGGVGAAALSVGAVSARRLIGQTALEANYMIKWDVPTETLGKIETDSLIGRATRTGGIKLGIEGKADLLIGSLAIGATGAFKELKQQKLGVQDNFLTAMSPRTPSYAENAGATGDLVFALNRNKRRR